MPDSYLLARTLRYVFFAMLAYAAYFAIYKPGRVMWNTHRLVSELARENSSALAAGAVRREISENYRKRAETIGALKEAEIDVSLDDKTLVVSATGTVTARISECCSLIYETNLSSARKFLASLKHPE